MNIRLTQPLKGRSSSCSFSLCLYVCVSQCILLCILVFCPSYVWLFWRLSLSVCVWKRERGTQRCGKMGREREREWGETASAADFQLLHFSPSLSGFSFPPPPFFPLTWSPYLPCERIEPHWGFHIFLIPVLRCWALGRQDVPLLVVRPSGGEWEGISGPDRHPVQWAYLVDAPKVSPPL